MPFLVEWNAFGPCIEPPGHVEAWFEAEDWMRAVGATIATVLGAVAAELSDFPFDEPGITIEVQVTRVAKVGDNPLFARIEGDHDVVIWPQSGRWRLRYEEEGGSKS